MSFVSGTNIHRVFSSHFSGYFHSVTPRVVNIVSGYCVFLCAFLCSLRVVLSMRQHCFQCGTSSSYFFSWHIYNLSKSSLVCKTSCIVISFFVLWSICLIFFSGPLHEWSRVFYDVSPQVFMPFIKFLLYSFVSSDFLVLQRYSLSIFSFLSTCLIKSASNMPKYL